tara:strand:+ start:705 stop:905 length:201 start_codon:yes stop_codon:yes gene_type:complete
MTSTQKRTLDFIKEFWNDHGYSPSFQEISNHMQWKSKSTAHMMIKRLSERNEISYIPAKARSIKLV